MVCSLLLIPRSAQRVRPAVVAGRTILLCFGFLGTALAQITGLFVPLTVMLLCFIMGLQNELITKLSRAEIRTTHITGIVTDIGIELGKLVYWSHSSSSGSGNVMADRQRLRLLALLLLFFFLGGVLGAFGFNHLGYVSTVPLALLLVTLAGVPALDDLRSMGKRMLR